MKVLDRLFGVLLILGGCGHTAGTILGYRGKPELMLWSLSTSCFIFLLGSVNLLRSGRPGDRAMGWICLVFNLCWFAGGLQFGHLIGNMADPRVIGFAIITLVLSWMSLSTIVSVRPGMHGPR